ncbi:putative nuclease HARBI1 isoform X1 [Senna tora]|uniref:Putative nuclease HARBI1 isoform X1 n=1 Tax=Senna tora TaxID=362788 RepID=A0A834SVS1_9FABA|nr:putative nuclease HARBI1 isoform X1 [Senna tora]
MRAQIMTQIASAEGRKIVRMGPETFLDLCDKLQQFGRLLPTRQATVEEQVAKTLYILTHNVRNREIQFWFRRSGETTSRHFHHVIRSLIELEDKYLKQSDGSEIPLEILGNKKFYPYFKTKPKAEEWMRKPIAHYDKMMVIYGNDRATGQVSTTAKEKRKRPLIEETESLDTIDASSEMGNQDLGDDNAVTSPAVQIVQDLGENSSKKNKNTNKCDKETERVGKALEDIAQAIKDGNTIFEKVMQKNPISEAEVWKLLKDLNIDAQLIGSVYLYLVENPHKLRALIGLPNENRKAFLLQIVFASSNPPSLLLDIVLVKLLLREPIGKGRTYGALKESVVIIPAFGLQLETHYKR